MELWRKEGTKFDVRTVNKKRIFDENSVESVHSIEDGNKL